MSLFDDDTLPPHVSLPVNLTLIDGDLLDMPSLGYLIGHQCNTMSTVVSGLAKSIYDRYPTANIRGNLVCPAWVGSYDMDSPVVNFYTQLRPGKPNTQHPHLRLMPDDSVDVRMRFMKSAWESFATTFPASNIAIPYGYGCGLAGGDWELDYFPFFINFATINPLIQLVIVRKK